MDMHSLIYNVNLTENNLEKTNDVSCESYRLNLAYHFKNLEGDVLKASTDKGSNSHSIFPAASLQDRKNIIHRKIIYDAIVRSIQIQEEKKKYAEKAGVKRKILVVDEDDVNLQVLINYLGNEDYSLAVASNGIEALDKINNGNFDLVLLDIMMPRMSGLDVCKNIRKNYKPYELPVIMLTAKNNISDIKSGFSAGANDYIVKPFDREELLSRVNTLVSLKESVAQIKELKNNIETIVANIPEGVLLISPELEISYLNNRFRELFKVQEDTDKNLPELFDKEIYKKIHNFAKKKKDKLIFEWIIGNETNPILISIILKFINEKFILMVASEIKDVLAEKELQTCYYIIRGFSERETAKLLYKSRTTVNSNKLRAKDKLKQIGYTAMLKKLE